MSRKGRMIVPRGPRLKTPETPRQLLLNIEEQKCFRGGWHEVSLSNGCRFVADGRFWLGPDGDIANSHL